MTDILVRLVEDNKIEALTFVGILFFIIWLYKEFRRSFIDTKVESKERIDKALLAYGEVSYAIITYKKDKTKVNELEESFSKAYMYFPKELLKKIIKWIKHHDVELLNGIYEDLQNEIIYIKSNQFDIVSFGVTNKFSIIDYIEYSIRKLNIDSFALPAMYTFALFIFLIMIIKAIFDINSLDYKNKILMYFIYISIILIIIFIIGVVDLIINDKFIRSFKSLLSITAVISFSLLLLFKGPWYRGIIDVAIIFIYLIFVIRKINVKD